MRRNWGPKSFCGEASDSPRLGASCLRSVCISLSVSIELIETASGDSLTLLSLGIFRSSLWGNSKCLFYYILPRA